ncbi:MAG TPA: hypothetical protein PLW93_04520 [Candidatus Absconditabacterales bacterium]|nr:hypothetical protein [Candidatus Absconditabacterales bacterium]HNG97506.1 hypothetical protein [Candidatus Absconditabacterales bacterium]
MNPSLLYQECEIYQPMIINTGGIQHIQRNLVGTYACRISTYNKPSFLDQTQSNVRHITTKEYKLFLHPDSDVQKGYKVHVEGMDYEIHSVDIIGGHNAVHHKECICSLWE